VGWKYGLEYRYQILNLRRGGIGVLVVLVLLGIFTPLIMVPSGSRHP
jgi:hypothetical protein